VQSAAANQVSVMAAFKSIFVFALMGLGMVSYNPAMGQAISNTQSALDFWLTFGELLTEDVVDELSKITLPALALPNIPDQNQLHFQFLPQHQDQLQHQAFFQPSQQSQQEFQLKSQPSTTTCTKFTSVRSVAAQHQSFHPQSSHHQLQPSLMAAKPANPRR
jgi:hypothetical protein